MKKFGLIPKLILSIILGILLGTYAPQKIVEILATFNGLFSNFLGFIIPLIIIGFIVSGIADLGKGAGKLLGITTALAYSSTLIAGFFAYFVSKNLFPKFITASNLLSNAGNPEDKLLKPLLTMKIPPIMDVMSALIFAFMLGIGISTLKSKALYNCFSEFQNIVEKTISKVVIPLLPIHIMGIFANMAFAGEVFKIISVFWKVFIIVILMHIVIIIFQFIVATFISKKNFFHCIKSQIPAYLTAIGTQSSAATIPVNLNCSEKMGVSKSIREFVVPLCATIHLSGSTITLTSCALAVMFLNNMSLQPSQIVIFICMLGITMVAAPGVPGGAVMAALGILQSILGFSEAQTALMIALYITQDSFGTACNVCGDNAIAMVVDKISTRVLKQT